jgi:hypothetical protein
MILKALTIKITVFWDMILCNLAERYHVTCYSAATSDDLVVSIC